MKKKILISAGVVAVAAVLGLGIYQSDASHADPKLSVENVKSLVGSQYPGTITEMELEKHQNKAVYEIEIENGDMEYELKIDGNSGEVIKLKEKRIASKQDNPKLEVVELEKDADDKAVTPTKTEQKQAAKNEKNAAKEKQPQLIEDKNTVITVDKAVAIAQKEFPGTVKEVELDEDDGRLIYEIEIKANGEEADFEIDAMTGEIILIEIDD